DVLAVFFAPPTRSSSAFGVELDSLADVVSFGLAPAILAFTWGLWPLRRLGRGGGVIYCTASSLAAVVSFGLAPAILAFTWGLWPLGRLGWGAGFIYVTAAAMRLARFNIQTGGTTDKRHVVAVDA